MKAYQQNLMPKRIFAGLLAVWMSGVVFLFCCGVPKAQAAEIESCPLAKTSHCHKSASEKSSKDEHVLRVETFQSDGLAFDCCGFLPGFFDKARKVEKSEQIAAVAGIKPQFVLPSFSLVRTRPITFYNYHPRLPDGSGTYLKNRVFRI